MKNNQLTIAAVHLDTATEGTLIKQDGSLKALAEKNARHFAARNLPAPSEDRLVHYIGELKAGYEKLAADIFHHLQPAANFPEAKIEADHYRAKDAELEEHIAALTHQNHADGYDLAGFNPGTLNLRLLWAFISTMIISLGEIMFNTKAFQVTGENLLFALVLSISVSFAVFLFSHMVPLLYKAAKTKVQKRLLLIGAAIVVTLVFTALAIFRSEYLAAHDVHISPFYFVLINLFFFIVSTVLSFFVLPTWQELKENARHLHQHLAMRKRTKVMARLQQEREAIREAVLAKTKERVRIMHLTNDTMERLRKMYRECAELFKRTNLTYRSDNRPPDCFSDDLGPLDIPDLPFNSPTTRKP